MTSGQSATVQRVMLPETADAPATSLYVRVRAGKASWQRRALHLAEQSDVTFATYFGAFPVAVWRRLAGLRSISLVGQVDGEAACAICVRDRTGGVRRREFEVSSEAFEESVILAPDDEWAWLEIRTGDAAAVMKDLAWTSEATTMRRTGVCITTHDRPDDCVRVLRALGADPDVLEYIDSVVVVDQGTAPVSEANGFVAVARSLGERLQVIRQRNLGGSGGFSRGMLESVARDVEELILLDDDVALETESLRRLIALSSRSTQPVIIGAHMLDMYQPSRLHSWGEKVSSSRFEWTSVAPDLDRADLSAVDITRVPARVEVDFNGWWMCLIPSDAVRRIGAAMPYFIKWDDTEYSLRATSAGIPTVVLPGAALWHVSWVDKDDGLDWQAYFQLRNRLVTALLHGAEPRGRGLLQVTLAQDVNHVLCMQYGSAAARRQALRDVLSGPRHLEATLVTRLDDMRELLRTAGQVVIPDPALPRARGLVSPARPSGAPRTLARVSRVIVRQLRRPVHAADGAVEVALTRQEGKWWSLGLVDSATVSSATGRGSFVARRSRRRAAALIRDALLLRLRLWWVWPRLARDYRRSARLLASAEAWSERFSPDTRMKGSDGHS